MQDYPKEMYCQGTIYIVDDKQEEKEVIAKIKRKNGELY